MSDEDTEDYASTSQLIFYRKGIFAFAAIMAIVTIVTVFVIFGMIFSHKPKLSPTPVTVEDPIPAPPQNVLPLVQEDPMPTPEI